MFVLFELPSVLHDLLKNHVFIGACFLVNCCTGFLIISDNRPVSSPSCSYRASVPVVRGAAFGGWPAQLGPLGLSAPTASDATPVGAAAGPGGASAAGDGPKRHPGRSPSQCNPKYQFSRRKPQPHQPQYQPQSQPGSA